MEQTENKMVGQATPEQIKAWKEKFGDIFAVKCDNHIAYLKTPSRKVLGYAAVAGKDNPLKFNEVILNDCFVGGSEAIKTDDKLFLGVSSKLAEIIEIKEVELEKL